MLMDEFVPLAVAVIRKDRKILIARRKRAFMGYLWEFPWNRPEDHETLQGGLKRGIREELGIDVEVGNMFSSSGHVINCQLNMKVYAYEVEWVSGEFALTEYEEIRWVEADDLAAYNFAEPHRYIVRVLTGKA